MSHLQAWRLDRKGRISMSEWERAEALIEEAARCGLQIGYDAGFCVVSRLATAAPPRDGAAETEQAIMEALGGSLRDVFAAAIARARCARGKDLVGQQVFIPSHQIFGRLAGFSAEGTVSVSYRQNVHPERISDLNYSGPGEDLLLIVDDERPAPASPPSFSWISYDKVRLLFELAASVGLSLEHDSGFVVARCRTIEGVERDAVEAAIRRLGKSMGEIFAHTVGRARGERGADFVGQRLFIPQLNAFGILSSCDVDGDFTLTYFDDEMESRRTVHWRGDALLVILAGAEEAAQDSSADQKSEASWRRLVRRAFGA